MEDKEPNYEDVKEYFDKLMASSVNINLKTGEYNHDRMKEFCEQLIHSPNQYKPLPIMGTKKFLEAIGVDLTTMKYKGE